MDSHWQRRCTPRNPDRRGRPRRGDGGQAQSCLGVLGAAQIWILPPLSSVRGQKRSALACLAGLNFRGEKKAEGGVGFGSESESGHSGRE